MLSCELQVTTGSNPEPLVHYRDTSPAGSLEFSAEHFWSFPVKDTGFGFVGCPEEVQEPIF